VRLRNADCQFRIEEKSSVIANPQSTIRNPKCVYWAFPPLRKNAATGVGVLQARGVYPAFFWRGSVPQKSTAALAQKACATFRMPNARE